MVIQEVSLDTANYRLQFLSTIRVIGWCRLTDAFNPVTH
jgi:hypothetical protein